MRRTTWLTAALGVTMIATPVLAQTQHHPRNDTMREMQRERQDPNMSAVPRQDRDSTVADDVDARGIHDWLRQAKAAIGRGQIGQANEFLERAETRMLSRSTAPERAGQPMASPRLTAISSAREALRNRDRREAMRQIDAALGGA
nr:hypothetical protein [uncultured Roseococcus sp.]